MILTILIIFSTFFSTAALRDLKPTGLRIDSQKVPPLTHNVVTIQCMHNVEHIKDTFIMYIFINILVICCVFQKEYLHTITIIHSIFVFFLFLFRSSFQRAESERRPEREREWVKETETFHIDLLSKTSGHHTEPHEWFRTTKFPQRAKQWHLINHKWPTKLPFPDQRQATDTGYQKEAHGQLVYVSRTVYWCYLLPAKL